MLLAWGKAVSEEFRDKVIEIGDELDVNPSWLMAIMAFESARTFSASVKNAAGSGAVGLIQFMPQTAFVLGTSTTALEAMSAEDQLDYVHQYFEAYTGKIHTLSDLYMVVLWPAAVGKPEDYVLFDQADPAHPRRYIENKGLDWNHDGKITKAEAAQGPVNRLQEGMMPSWIYDTALPTDPSAGVNA